MISMLLYAGILGGCVILFLGGAGALREAVRQRARPRGFAMALAVMAASVLGVWALLI
ncbi:MAG: hypothetical protein AB7L66_03355 [Gemmatimonadales bacterium]